MGTYGRFAVAVATVGAIACSSSDSGSGPAAGAADTLTHEVAGQPVSRTTFRAIELEDAAMVAKHPGASATAWVVEKVERLDGATPRATLTPAQVIAFVRDEWDASVGGDEDEGVDAAKLVETLSALSLTPERFIRAYRAMQGTLPDFTAFVSSLRPLNEVHPHMGVEVLLDTFEAGGVTLAELQRALGVRGVALADLVAELKAHPNGAHQLRTAWWQGGKSLGKTLETSLATKPTKPTTPSTLFGFTRPSWQLSDNNTARPVDARTRTAILNYQALDATTYTGGVAFQGPSFRDTWDNSDVKVQGYVGGQYNGMNPTYGGSYLPDTYVQLTEFKVVSDSLVASVSFTGVSNIGPSADDPDPQVSLLISLKACSSGIGGCKQWVVTQVLTGAAGAGSLTDGFLRPPPRGPEDR